MRSRKSVIQIGIHAATLLSHFRAGVSQIYKNNIGNTV